MSDNPTRCTTTLPVDSSRLSNRSTASELMELLQPLVDWQTFAIFLPNISSATIRMIEKDNQLIFGNWLSSQNGSELTLQLPGLM